MKSWLLVIALAAAAPALGQHHPGHAAKAHAHAGHSGYAGWQDRAIKALSDAQVAELRAGKGMGLALPAELNGYPGPSHVLELAGPLGLSTGQVQKTQELFDAMRAEAKTLGEKVITGERDLDRLFRDRKADVVALNGAVAKAAGAQGELRAAHLRYHLAMVDVLTPAQVASYNTLRGYD